MEMELPPTSFPPPSHHCFPSTCLEMDHLFSFLICCLSFRNHHNGPTTVSSSSNIANPMMMNAPNNHHVLTPVPGDPSGRLVMTLLPSQGHDLMHGQHDASLHHHSGASHTSSSHSTRYNHPGWFLNLFLIPSQIVINRNRPDEFWRVSRSFRLINWVCDVIRI